MFFGREKGLWVHDASGDGIVTKATIYVLLRSLVYTPLSLQAQDECGRIAVIFYIFSRKKSENLEKKCLFIRAHKFIKAFFEKNAVSTCDSECLIVCYGSYASAYLLHANTVEYAAGLRFG